jgi:hypothetical protein
MNKGLQKGGTLIQLVVWIVIIVLILSLLGVSIQTDIFSNSFVQENFGFIFNWFGSVWDSYLSNPITYLWGDIFLDLLWSPLLDSFGSFNPEGGLLNLFDTSNLSQPVSDGLQTNDGISQ